MPLKNHLDLTAALANHLDLTAALADAMKERLSHLFEVLMDDHWVGGEKETNDEAMRRFEVGVRHLVDVYAEASDIVNKI